MECASAAMAGVAFSTPEEKEAIKEICDFAVRKAPTLNRDSGNARKTYVWHQSTGFRRYGLFADDEDGAYVPVEELDEDDERSLMCRPIEGEDVAVDDYDEIFSFIRDYDPKAQSGGVNFVLCDWQNFIGSAPMPKEPTTLDAQKVLLRDICDSGQPKTVIMLSPEAWKIPVELEQLIRVIDLPLPTLTDRTQMVTRYVETFKNDPDQFSDYQLPAQLTQEEIEVVARACSGFTSFETENNLLMSLGSTGTFSPEWLNNERTNIMKAKGMNILKTEVTFDDLGGLDNVKRIVQVNAQRFKPNAIEKFGRPPMGTIFHGLHGTGKTMIAKAMANSMNMQLYLMQANHMKNELVGGSENLFRNQLKQFVAGAPCIVLVDEAEKLFATTDAARDGGASQGVLSLLLTFMQENTDGVYFVFTCNHMDKLPRELLDRFEDKFFFDLPTEEARDEIFKLTLTELKENPDNFDIEALAAQTEDFNGRGIEAAVRKACAVSFADGEREPTMDELVEALEMVGPAADQKTIEALREEAMAKRLIPASARPNADKAKAVPRDFSRI